MCVVLQYIHGYYATLYVRLCVWYYTICPWILCMQHCMCGFMRVVLQYVHGYYACKNCMCGITVCVWYYSMSMDIMQHCVCGIMCVVLQYDHGYYLALYVWYYVWGITVCIKYMDIMWHSICGIMCMCGITLCPWILCNTVYVVLCVWYYSMTMDIMRHLCVVICVWYYSMSMDIMQHCMCGIMCVVFQYVHGYYATNIRSTTVHHFKDLNRLKQKKTKSILCFHFIPFHPTTLTYTTSNSLDLHH
jgi:hypothetical protein